MKAAIYLRVSTDEQQHANQQPDCERVCTARGWDPLLVVETESGAKERPGWAHVLELARTGQIGAVVIWALDRAGRTRVQVAHDLGELFRWRVQVVSVRDPWLDATPGPLRDLLVQVLAWVAEGEREQLVARTRAGLARARAAGKTLGRPKADEKQLRMAALAVQTGATLQGAARVFGVGRTTLRDYMAEKGLRKPAQKPAERRAS
jgi:putative DNA-invertase from lambdoid prophage Rac